MKKIALFLIAIVAGLNTQAAKIYINQIPANGNSLQVSINVGDTVFFGFPSQYTIKQVYENQNPYPGGYNFDGKGILVFSASGNSHFLIQAPNGMVVKGLISTMSVLKVSNLQRDNILDTKVINGRLMVSIKESNANGLICLHDVLGNKIFESPANDNVDWSMAGLKSGVYFVVWKEGKNNFTKRILFRQEN
jgi:hypothetical protein